MTSALQECIGPEQMLNELGLCAGNPIRVYEDNHGAQHLAENRKGITHRRKYINVSYHWIRDHVKSGDVRIGFFPTNETDFFTKPLGRVKFERFRHELGMRQVGVLEFDDDIQVQDGIKFGS